MPSFYWILCQIFREADAVDCKDLGIYDILVAYVADDRDMQGKITVCSGGHEVKWSQARSN